MVAATPCALGQTSGGRVALVPSFSVTETVSDNYKLSATDKSSDAITQLTAGVSWRAPASAWLNGFARYALTDVVYAKHSADNSFQNALSANVNAELVERQVFVNASATVTRGAVSAFGAPVNGDALANTNSTEVRTYQVTPSVRGVLAGAISYSASLSHSQSDTKNSDLGQSRSDTAALRLASARGGPLGWAIDASRTLAGNGAGSQGTADSRVFATVSYDLSAADLRLSVNGGRETTNLTSPTNQSGGTWGVAVDWTPSPRTHARARYDHRAFGTTSNFDIDYRTPLTVWQIGSSRSVSTSGTSLVPGSQGTAFDLFFAQLASVEPDPAKRAQMTLDLLQRIGMNPLGAPAAGFLTGQATLVQEQHASAAWRGLRDTATFTVSRSASRRADPLANAVGDLALASEVTTRSGSLNLSHRLTPASSLTLTGSAQRSAGTGTSQLSRSRTLNIQWITQLGRNLNLSVGARRTLVQTGQQAYSESAAMAALGATF